MSKFPKTHVHWRYSVSFQAAAGTAAAVGTVQNANTNANLDASNRRIDSADTKAKATCTAVILHLP